MTQPENQNQRSPTPSNEVAEDNYPCYGHECYDQENYHVSCTACLLHKGRC